MSRIIGPFEGEYRYLSNFFIEPDKTHVEGEFQSMKSDPPTEWLRIISPWEAKRCGRKLTLRPDWEAIKIGVMQGLVKKKFHDHPELAEKLISTGYCELIEINHWGDTFWGVHNGYGMNWLGRILMHIRDDFNQGSLFSHLP